jgi:hypothetical protein
LAGPPERIYLRGFSLLAPPGGKWCTTGPNIANTEIVLRKITEYGKTEAEVTAEERAQTFFLQAALKSVPRSATADIDALLGYARSLRDSYHGGRFALLSYEAGRDDLQGFQCVRYSLSQLERENPYFPGADLITEFVGYFCLNPGSAGTVIDVGYSERYIKDRRPGPSLMTELAPEIYTSLQSLRVETAAPPMSRQALALIVGAVVAGLGFIGWTASAVIAIRRETTGRRLARWPFASWWVPLVSLVLVLFARVPPELSSNLVFAFACLGFIVIAPPVFAFFFFQRVVWRASDAGFGKRIAYLTIIPIINVVTIAILAFAPSTVDAVRVA